MDPETLKQYRAVREKTGRMDRSDAGRLAIVGPDRFSWLQGMVSNDVRRIEGTDGRLPACILDATGHVLSDVTLINILQEDPDPFAAAPELPPGDFVLLELPRENVANILNILDRLLVMEDVEIRDVSDVVGCYSLQGPEEADGPETGRHDQRYCETFYAVKADHTGSGGIDLYFARSNEYAARFFDTEAGFPTWAPEVGTEAQEILRVEAGIPKYGADMDASVLAPETGLTATHISLTKGCYVGQEVVARIESRGHTNRALTGLVVEEGAPPDPGDKILPMPTDEEPLPRETGRITSVVPCAPAVGGRAIALGYVRHAHRTPGGRLRVQGRRGETVVTVAELPFYRRLPA